MPVGLDPDPKLAQYAHPERLVTTDWLAEHLGEPGLVVVESDEDVLLYDTGHIPGAVKVDWHTDLNDPVIRDYVDGERFAKLLGAKGIARDTTVVIYGDKNNWWAAYALWVFKLFGHEDVRLLDGGRAKWIAEGRELTTEVPAPTPVEYPVVERDDARDPRLQGGRARAPRHAERPPADRRALPRGVHRRADPHARTTRRRARCAAGTSPARQSVPWARAAAEDATFKGREELEAIYSGEQGLKPTRRRHRLLPDRRALEPHLVRADLPARLRERAQLRRLLDRVGQHRARAHRARRGARLALHDGPARGRLHLRRRRGGGGQARPARPRVRAADPVAARPLGARPRRAGRGPRVRAGAHDAAAARRWSSRRGWSAWSGRPRTRRSPAASWRTCRAWRCSRTTSRSRCPWRAPTWCSRGSC